MPPGIDARLRPTPEDPAAMMAAYGIEHVPVDYFHWNGFRYSTLKDAVAAARRDERAVRHPAHV